MLCGPRLGGGSSVEAFEETGRVESVGGGIPNETGLNVLPRYAVCGRTGFTYGTVGCTSGLGTGGTLFAGIVDGVLGRLSEVIAGLIFSTD